MIKTSRQLKALVRNESKGDSSKALYIMDESEYPGIRVELEAQIEGTSIPFKLDFSVGDKITPEEVEYAYPLIFEERTIPLIAYNVESILAEKYRNYLIMGCSKYQSKRLL